MMVWRGDNWIHLALDITEWRFCVQDIGYWRFIKGRECHDPLSDSSLYLLTAYLKAVSAAQIIQRQIRG
jgi:hypothetical protein